MESIDPKAQPIVGYVYHLTDKGHDRLRRKGADISSLEQEILIRIDGRTTREQLILDMAPQDQFQINKTIAVLQNAGMIMQSGVLLPEDKSLDFTDMLERPPAAIAVDEERSASLGDEADNSLLSLNQRGYYVSIARRAAEKRLPGNGSRYSLLVVEDDSSTAHLLKLLLANEGFSVSLAGNRSEFLQALSNPPLPDAMLLDGYLPDLDGFDLLAKMQAHPVLSGIPVIMLTARSEREDVLRGLTAGASGYITKPFDLDRVVSGVRDVLGD